MSMKSRLTVSDVASVGGCLESDISVVLQDCKDVVCHMVEMNI